MHMHVRCHAFDWLQIDPLLVFFFLWEDVLVQTQMNQLLIEHHEWLPQTAAAVTRAPEEETEGRARIDIEVADEQRRLNQKITKLEYQAQILICIWAFVGGMLEIGRASCRERVYVLV